MLYHTNSKVWQQIFRYKQNGKSKGDIGKDEVGGSNPPSSSKSLENFGLTVIRNEITYQLLADGFRVHTKLPSDS